MGRSDRRGGDDFHYIRRCLRSRRAAAARQAQLSTGTALLPIGVGYLARHSAAFAAGQVALRILEHIWTTVPLRTVERLGLRTCVGICPAALVVPNGIG